MNNSTTTNATLFYHTSNNIIGWFWIGIFCSYSLVLAFLLLLRRNYQPVKARGAPMMMLALVIYTTYVLGAAFRSALGREQYPCFLWWFLFSSSPLNGLVTIVKCWRLVFLHMSSHSKIEDVSMNASFRTFNRGTKKVKIYSILASYWATGALLLFFLAVHVALSGTTIGVIPANPGCYTSGWSANLLLGQVIAMGGVYFALLLVLAVFACVKRVRDTWGITRELVMVPMYWIPILGLFGIAYLGVDRGYWPERYVASNIFLMIGSFIDISVTILIPILQSFSCASCIKKPVEQEQEIKDDNALLLKVLNNEVSRTMFLKFCTRSFCPEQVLFWNDVKFKYQACTTKEGRRDFADKIVQTYLVSGSVNELNLPTVARSIWLPSIKKQFKAIDDKQQEDLDTTLFNSFITHAEMDMLDSLGRFKKTNEYITWSEGKASTKKCCCC